MKGLSFYDQAGIIVPGSLLLVFVYFEFQARLALPPLKDLNLGGLGVYVILAYAAGQFVAALSNLLEALLWLPFGGKPSEWLVKTHQTILSKTQVEMVREKIKKRHKEEITNIAGLNRSAWRTHFSLIYIDVLDAKPGRVPTLNGLYGLSRGLATSALLIAGLNGPLYKDHFLLIAGCLVVSFIFLYRTYEFGKYLAVEVFSNFLLIESIVVRKRPALTAPSKTPQG